ncbi:CpsD/CapB family tyrosine-protein kinase [Paenibacillus sp. J2TS4]|uniref:CpsD/CapB family tyrosine-protein kinase n=1 Tax=Paenibacillus sp. J2TS4 TaxID=2807194 RepID=UPI001AFEDF8C|nr:CpsD/CapB family tyrosine-protein kinase [Paenibacillus sp. J2TS4]GIP35031.1 tyrosine-protein kinase YwqD [Paenibacillus sp. J2TS4]
MSRLDNSGGRAIIADVNMKSPISEAYRTLRTNIDFSAIDSQIQIIMLTSPGAGEGKSTTTANLATVYAQAEKKVLIIDADLRKPTMHRIFAKTNRWGLTSVLTGQSVSSKVIMETHIAHLDLLTSGPVPPNPSEMLSSRRMSELLDELRSRYDVILMDTPPLLAVTDAQLVATKSDGVILVIDSGKVKRDSALKAKANLELVQARILGAVLNNVERRRKDDSYYYYYGSQD